MQLEEEYKICPNTSLLFVFLFGQIKTLFKTTMKAKVNN